MKIILLIDCNYLCHRAFHSLPELSAFGRPTQIIFGFLKEVIKLLEHFNPENLVFAWDSPISFREELYPEYKANRKSDRERMSEKDKRLRKIAYGQFNLIREEVLRELGFTNNFCAEGIEGDDIIASVASTGSETIRFIMVTTDKDMYQMISPNCDFYNPKVKNLTRLEDFEKEWGCSPDTWKQAKVIAGCSTDNVKGIRGVGEKTAIKFLTNKMPKTGKTYYKILDQMDAVVKQNAPLIVLPFEGAPRFELKRNELSKRKFGDVCSKYNFMSLINEKNIDVWGEASERLN